MFHGEQSNGKRKSENGKLKGLFHEEQSFYNTLYTNALLNNHTPSVSIRNSTILHILQRLIKV